VPTLHRESRLDTPESRDKCFFSLLLTTLSVLVLFFDFTQSGSEFFMDLSSAKIASRLSSSAGFERRDTWLSDEKGFLGIVLFGSALEIDRSGAMRGARPSGEGGFRVMQHEVAIMP